MRINPCHFHKRWRREPKTHHSRSNFHRYNLQQRGLLPLPTGIPTTGGLAESALRYCQPAALWALLGHKCKSKKGQNVVKGKCFRKIPCNFGKGYLSFAFLWLFNARN